MTDTVYTLLYREGRASAWRIYTLWGDPAPLPFVAWARMHETRRMWRGARGEAFTAGFYSIVDTLARFGR